MADIYHYSVISTQITGASTMEVLLHADHPHKVMSFEPGQYAAISFVRHRRPTPTRCFSLTSSPTDQTKLQFGIHVKGLYTTAAQEALTVGSQVIVEGPFGSCVFNADRDKSAVMIGGGIGITPFMSMMRFASRLQLKNDLYLFYSNHSQDDIPFIQEIIKIAQVNPRLHLYFVIGDGPTDRMSGLNVITGRIDLAKLTSALGGAFKTSSYFVCGPPGFMHGISNQIIAGGVPATQVMTETFSQGQVGPRTLRHNVPLQIYAATGLSIVLGSATILARDAFLTPVSYATTGGTTETQAQAAGASPNSRQQAVQNTINGLSGSGSSSKNSSSSQSSNSGSVTINSNGTVTVTGGGSSKSGSGGSSGLSGSHGSSGGGSPSPTPTPSPSPSPSPSPQPKTAPVVSLSASSTSITSGQSATLSWSINVDATLPVTCSASGGWSGSKATSGSQSVSPSSTKTYTLVCSNSAGSNTQSVTVNVAPACISTPSNPC